MSVPGPSIVPSFEPLLKAEDSLLEIVSHLGAALIQSDHTDDPIIIEHVRNAHRIALNLHRAARAAAV